MIAAQAAIGNTGRTSGVPGMASPTSGTAPGGITRAGLREWHPQASCQGSDLRLFFPGPGGSTHAAKRICSVCGVRAECLEHALVQREDHGVWGGLDEDGRHRLRHQMRKRSGTSHRSGGGSSLTYRDRYGVLGSPDAAAYAQSPPDPRSGARPGSPAATGTTTRPAAGPQLPEQI